MHTVVTQNRNQCGAGRTVRLAEHRTPVFVHARWSYLENSTTAAGFKTAFKKLKVVKSSLFTASSSSQRDGATHSMHVRGAYLFPCLFLKLLKAQKRFKRGMHLNIKLICFPHFCRYVTFSSALSALSAYVLSHGESTVH